MASHARRSFKRCEDCNKPGTVGKELSVRGLCEPCREARMMKAATQLAEGAGPYYDQWLASMRDATRRLADKFAD